MVCVIDGDIFIFEFLYYGNCNEMSEDLYFGLVVKLVEYGIELLED